LKWALQKALKCQWTIWKTCWHLYRNGSRKKARRAFADGLSVLS
jgi:hypothetical protein